MPDKPQTQLIRELSPISEIPDHLRNRFAEVGEESLRLFAAAADSANLLEMDFLTLADLVEAAGPDATEPLHVMLLCMLLALEEGSLCVEASVGGWQRRLSDLAGETEARNWAARIQADLEKGFPSLIGSDAHAQKPLVLVNAGGRQFLYFQKFLLHESIFHEALQKRLTAMGPEKDRTRLQEAMVAVLETHPLRVDGQPLVLDARQRQALELALTRDFALISGGPGTGKTSIVLSLLRCLVRSGCSAERIALAAPTGRAAQRLTDAVLGGLASLTEADRQPADDTLDHLSAQTLHRLLRYSPTRGSYGRHCENTIPADVIIVDEVSMVGVALMSQLLQATALETKLVLLGDKDQLPSVEAGAVLGSLVAERNGSTTFETPDFLVVLEENYRSQPEIRAAARAINQQDGTILDRLPQANFQTLEEFGVLEREGGCWWLPQTGGSVRELQDLVECWARQQYLRASGGQPSYADMVQRCAGRPIAEEMAPGQGEDLQRLFHLLGRGRLLTVIREGPWGCVDINGFLAQKLRTRWDRAGRDGLFSGAPVLITRNDYTRQLFNGDVGIALRSAGGGHHVVFPRRQGFVAYPADSLPAHELGFALTVHKSQGSEYAQVLLILPPQGAGRLLTKEIVYTGITRAKQLAVVASTRQVLEFAISRRIERDTGLVFNSLSAATHSQTHPSSENRVPESDK